MEELMQTCPRRREDGRMILGVGENSNDMWEDRGKGFLQCSYCGSMHPDKVMELAEAHTELIPTDKNYKIYVDRDFKFYFQHLSETQKNRFLELMNEKKLNIGYPGYFYVLPFFISPKSSSSN